MQKGDIQFVVDDSVFNYRIVVLLNTPDGYIFEKSGDGYLFAVGGKASINEDSIKTARRELMEEIGLETVGLKLAAIIENFFILPGDGSRYHEVSLVYRATVTTRLDFGELKSSNSHNLGFVAIKPENFSGVDIKPAVLPKIILENKEFVHIINKET